MGVVARSIKYTALTIVKRRNLGWLIKNVAQESGIAYIKLAQILATRVDLLSAKSIAEIASISDNINPIDHREIIRIIEQEYNKPLRKVFAKFDRNPLGSASVSQVHKAALKDGSKVAVKVKRADLLATLDHDLHFMRNALNFLALFSKKLRFVKRSGVLDDYFDWIASETDFTREKQNLRKMYDYTVQLNTDSNGHVVPLAVHEQLCTENIIVMDFIPHKTFSQIQSESQNLDLQPGINSFFRSYFYAVFNYDKFLFHGDPHAGNIFFDENGNLGFLDYGLLFELNRHECEIIKKLTLLMYKHDVDGLQKFLLELTGKYRFHPREYRKERKLHYDLQVFVDSLDSTPITNWFMNMAFIMINNNLNGERLRFFYRFGKTMATFDGIVLAAANETDGCSLLETQFHRYYKREQLKNTVNKVDIFLNDLLWLAANP